VPQGPISSPVFKWTKATIKSRVGSIHWRHSGWCHPGRQTDDVTLFFPTKTDDLLKPFSSEKAFLFYLSSRRHSQPLRPPKSFVQSSLSNRPRKIKSHSGVTPWMVSPAVGPPSDATGSIQMLSMRDKWKVNSSESYFDSQFCSHFAHECSQ